MESLKVYFEGENPIYMPSFSTMRTGRKEAWERKEKGAF